jgi:hypothetical protein
MADLLQSNGTRLVLHKRDLSTREQWEEFYELLVDYPSIQCLRLQGMDIRKDEAARLGKASLQRLSSITFSRNSIGQEDGVLVRPCFPFCTPSLLCSGDLM